MPSHEVSLSTISAPTIKQASLIISLLALQGVPAVLCGPLAAQHYGAELCPLDIELVVRDADQAHAFDILTAHGLVSSLPTPSGNTPILPSPRNFHDWDLGASIYRDRRRLRQGGAIYEAAPPKLNQDHSVSSKFQPKVFVVLYPADLVGFDDTLLHKLPGLPAPVAREHVLTPTNMEGPTITNINECTSLVSATNGILDYATILPPILTLIESEIHFILAHTKPHTSIWGHHMSQLSALVRTSTCDKLGGVDGVQATVATKFKEFAIWFKGYLRGEADIEELTAIQGAYGRGYDDSVQPARL